MEPLLTGPTDRRGAQSVNYERQFHSYLTATSIERPHQSTSDLEKI